MIWRISFIRINLYVWFKNNANFSTSVQVILKTWFESQAKRYALYRKNRRDVISL